MKAIILAAGKGSRLYPLTLGQPKGLLKVGEETILDRIVRQLTYNGVNDILMVVGSNKDTLMEHFGSKVRYSFYQNFEHTNNLHTLWSVKDELEGDLVVTFADLILTDEIMTNMVKIEDDLCMVVDTSAVLDGTMRVSLNGNQIKSITTTTKEEAHGNFVGIAKFNSLGCELVKNEMKYLISGHTQEYYTIAIDNLARKGHSIGTYDAKGLFWREVDTMEEYQDFLNIYKKYL